MSKVMTAAMSAAISTVTRSTVNPGALMVKRDAFVERDEDVPFGEQKGLIFEKAPTDTCWMFHILMLPMAVLTVMLWLPAVKHYSEDIGTLVLLIWQFGFCF